MGSLVVLVVLCGAYSVSSPQPPHRRENGCTVGIHLDPHLVTPPSRQDDGNVRAPALVCVVVDCVQDCARGHGWWQDCDVVLLNIRTPPRTVPFASSFDLSEDSTFVIHRFVFLESSNSFTFQLVRDLEHTPSSISSHSYRTFHSYHTSQVQ